MPPAKPQPTSVIVTHDFLWRIALAITSRIVALDASIDMRRDISAPTCRSNGYCYGVGRLAILTYLFIAFLLTIPLLAWWQKTLAEHRRALEVTDEGREETRHRWWSSAVQKKRRTRASMPPAFGWANDRMFSSWSQANRRNAPPATALGKRPGASARFDA